MDTATKSPIRPATTTQTTTAARERERFAAWRQWKQSTKSNRDAAAASRDHNEAAVTEMAAMQTEATNAKQTARRNVTFQQFRQYKQWLATTGLMGSDGHAAAAGRILNNRRTAGADAAAKTETPSELAS